MGMTDVACLVATTPTVDDVTMTSTLRWTNSAAISAKRSSRPSGPAILDCDGATIDPAEFAQPLDKGGVPVALGRRCTRPYDSHGR
jgi:hypothetical protein